MNCERFQEDLFEYLDGTLAPDEKTAVQAHLETCDTCRQALENERRVSLTLPRRLGKAVDTVTVDAQARQSILNAVTKEIRNAPESKKILSFPSWFRVAIPAAAAVLVLIFAIHSRSPINQTNSFSPPVSAGIEIPVHVSYSAPRYAFHKEGAMVVDALISDTRVEDGALLANK